MSNSTKSFLIFLGILAIVFALNVAGHAQSRECVVQTYSSQIGVREATGHNDGEPAKYLKSVGLDKGYAWCAAFVNWVMEQCGADHAESGWSPHWFPLGKVIDPEKDTPLPGDVFGIYFPAKGRIAHVGFIHQWSSTKVVTVEGNTNDAGSREGDGVYKKIRLRKQISVVSRWLKN